MKKYTKIILTLLVIIGLGISVSACLPKKGSSKSQATAKQSSLNAAASDLSAEAALEKQQELLDQKGADGGLTVARLMIDGKQVDVASVSSVVLARTGKDDQAAATIIRFSEDKSALVFFSRNPSTGKGKILKVPAKDLASKPQFSFPVLKDGTLKTTNIAVMSVLNGS